MIDVLIQLFHRFEAFCIGLLVFLVMLIAWQPRKGILGAAIALPLLLIAAFVIHKFRL